MSDELKKNQIYIQISDLSKYIKYNNIQKYYKFDKESYIVKS